MTAERQPTPNDLQNEADTLQRRATRPMEPVWVGASAGSGKTSVLVNRLLRLMLPSKGRMASPPHKILCITFTKAGASEVMERVTKVLRGWAITDEADLRAHLAKLLEQDPDKDQMDAARALFARVIEAPGGMKIMTIHAFCQSVLARFPMEAGLPAGFEVIAEGEAQELLRQTRRLIITRLQTNAPEDKKLKNAFDILSAIRNADQLEDLMESMMAERARLRGLLVTHGNIDALEDAVFKALNVTQGTTRDSLLFRFFRDLPEGDLKTLCARLEGDNKTNAKKAEIIYRTLASQDREMLFDDYKSAFITKTEGTIAKPNGILKDDDTLASIYLAEGNRLITLESDLCNLATADATNALLRFSAAALDGYEKEKRARNRLDFEDLIDRTRRLLSGNGVDWVQYKLDGGIDHILVDEAQDTNPDQWDIIAALYDEFYAGTGMREPMTRTTFVVGDEKQSIFSFQRADPRVFGRQHDRLKIRAENAGTPLQSIPMQISFRSSPSILQMVDAVFASPEMRTGVLQDTNAVMNHYARQTGKAGRVELWPLIKRPERPEREAWSLPLRIEPGENPVAQMADAVARKIRTLLDDPAEMLESRNCRIRPGDIMILLSKRPPLAEAMLKALREHHIPVSGIDRMVVTKQLAVRDALSAIAFTLQPNDDLNLACLLKSPFIGFNEQQLFDASHGRENRPLWQVVKESGGPVAAWLSSLLASEGMGAGAFLHHVLYNACPADDRSGLRAILKRLGPDMRDPLQELLARADTHDMREHGGLQGFLQDALNDDSEIKRDLGEAGNVVRMMTVHGSKGLEAPIVFMPDTVRSTTRGGGSDHVLWPERDDKKGVPLWAASSESAAPAYDMRKATMRMRDDEEYRRLLYVALTRAADRLYIGGVQKAQSVNQKSWYFACEAAIKTIGHEHNGTWVVQNRQTDTVKDEKHEEKKSVADTPLPAWAFTPAPDAGSPPRPLMPSRPDQDDPSIMSPLFGDISHRFKRGRLIHTLFQFLPDLPEDERLPRAVQWLASPAHDIGVDTQNEILEATFNVLTDPAFAHIFTPAARAEVPLTGHLKTAAGSHTIVSGQIDRLLVEDSQVTVLDYKTNRPAPRTVEDVPTAYKKQMRTYRDILAEIWPGRAIRTVLIWTDGPALMDITDAL
jgi:ATP-dependent helicase/nuclease subunit A